MTNTSHEDSYHFKCHATSGSHYPLDSVSIAAILASVGANLVIGVLTVVLNALVMVVIFKTPRFRSSSNFLLFNAAITDFLTGLLSAPMFSGNFLLVYSKRSHDCTLFTATILIIHLFALLSFWIVLLVAVDRYIAIFKPYYYHEHISAKKIKYIVAIAILWILAASMIALPVLFGVFSVIMTIEAISLGFVTVSSTYIHIKIFLKVRTITGEIRTQTSRHGAWSRDCEHTKKQDLRVALLTFLMLASLVICYIPYAVVIFCWLAGMDTSWLQVLNMWGFTFVTLKSLLNPIIYCYSLATIRKAVKNLLHGNSSNDHSVSEWNMSRTVQLSVAAQKTECGARNRANSS